MKKVSLCMVIILCALTVFSIPVNAEEGYSDYLNNVIEMVQDRYYQDISGEKLIEGALRGIFNTMDDYTVFYDLDEANGFFSAMEGNYQGVGVQIMETTEGALVTNVFSNSPAQGAGILPNDLIVNVDGIDVEGHPLQDIANLIKGEKGTFVEIGILRGTSPETIFFNVERNMVNLSPVTWTIYDDVMYISLESFSSNSSYYFEQATKEADKRGISKLILDLRNNPGGEVSQAVNIARLLVSKGLITTLDFKSESVADESYQSYLDNPKYVSAVLVNGDSASASEILASAIKDSGDGFLVGTRTYGKGVFQNIYPILKPEAYEKYKAKYGESIVDGYEWINKHEVKIYQSEIIGWTKMTTGHYLTRNGKMINGVGLTPDFYVEDYSSIEGIDINSIKSLESTNTVYLNGFGNDVYNAEKILKIKGYAIEIPDNILDEKTSEIIKTYQREKGVKVTGILDDATRKLLNDDYLHLRNTIDRPYAKAMELLNLFE